MAADVVALWVRCLDVFDAWRAGHSAGHFLMWLQIDSTDVAEVEKEYSLTNCPPIVFGIFAD